jgi:hypothetical protein
LVYGTAIRWYYHLQEDYIYTYCSAAGGVFSAFTLGWMYKKDMHGILMVFMPWFLILSPILSGILKAFWKIWKRSTTEVVKAV